jgi:hypothetical protein
MISSLDYNLLKILIVIFIDFDELFWNFSLLKMFMFLQFFCFQKF